MYLPEINWLLAVLSIACVVGFRSTTAIGHAFGVAVVAVMVITTSLTALVMLIVWRTNPWLVALFWTALTFAEGIYLTSVLYKVRLDLCRCFNHVRRSYMHQLPAGGTLLGVGDLCRGQPPHLRTEQ